MRVERIGVQGEPVRVEHQHRQAGQQSDTQLTVRTPGQRWGAFQPPLEEPIHALAHQDGAAQQEHQHPTGVDVCPQQGEQRQANQPAPANVHQVAPEQPDHGRGEQQVQHLHAHAHHRAGQRQAQAQPHDAAEPADLGHAQGNGPPQDPEGQHREAAEQERQPGLTPWSKAVAERQENVRAPVLAGPRPAKGNDAPRVGARAPRPGAGSPRRPGCATTRRRRSAARWHAAARRPRRSPPRRRWRRRPLPLPRARQARSPRRRGCWSTCRGVYAGPGAFGHHPRSTAGRAGAAC